MEIIRIKEGKGINGLIPFGRLEIAVIKTGIRNIDDSLQAAAEEYAKKIAFEQKQNPEIVFYDAAIKEIFAPDIRAVSGIQLYVLPKK